MLEIMNFYSRRIRHSIILNTTVAVIVLCSLINNPSSTITTTTTFVTAAWASSSSGRNQQQYRTTTTESPFTTTTTTTATPFHQPLAPTVWGHTTKPSQRNHHHLYNTHRGGNQDQIRSYNSALSMADTTETTTATTTETSDAILSWIGSSGLSIENYQLLSDRGKIAIQNLICYDNEYQDQVHVYQNWPPPGIDDDNKIRLCEQVNAQFHQCVVRYDVQ